MVHWSIFHVNRSSLYPSVKDDRIVVQAEQLAGPPSYNFTINVFRSSKFTWDEQEFTKGGSLGHIFSNKPSKHVCPGFGGCPTYTNCAVRTLDHVLFLNEAGSWWWICYWWWSWPWLLLGFSWWYSVVV